MADHVTDVASTDQHTVKPWFDGRLDFAPPVLDFAPQGFVLVGGRLDYASNRPVAALVYKRRQHVINLFIFPEQGRLQADGSAIKQGYNLIHWNRSGMTFWAVSDLNLEELRQLANLYQDAQ
jgi:anti-sigma factor RsiW